MKADYLQCIDALEGMRSLPDNSVDVVITSPPYNMQTSSGGGNRWRGGTWANNSLVDGYDAHDDKMTIDQYNEWQHECLQEMWRVIKPTGAIFYNHKWRVQNGLLDMRQSIIRDLPVRQVIIWQTGGGVNVGRTHFIPGYEVIYFIPKPKFRLRKGHGRFDVWNVAPEQEKFHPAPFPIEIPRRLIDASSHADIILDPFCGSGTTCFAAKMLDRHYIGFDNSAKYIQYAENRISLLAQPLFQMMTQGSILESDHGRQEN